MSDYLLGIDAEVARKVALADEPALVAERALAEVQVSPSLRSRVLRSELEDIPDEAWTEFALSMKVAEPNAVSASNELGMFALKPRRLADLGLMKNLNCTRSATGRMVWVGDFVSPLTQKKFLASPGEQYSAFSKSMRSYVDGLRDGSIKRPDGGLPDDMTLSGVLAVLHRCGPSGLQTWNDEERRFSDTQELFDKANGIF